MATIRTVVGTDRVREGANVLALALGKVISAHTDSPSVAATAVAVALGAVLHLIPDDEFESVLGCVMEAARINRAKLQEPPRNKMN